MKISWLLFKVTFRNIMVCTFGSRGIICCDSTHGTNGYDFLLTSLLAIDEFGKGFPIAWCLSTHEDFTTLCIFLDQVKKNCGKLTPCNMVNE